MYEFLLLPKFGGWYVPQSSYLRFLKWSSTKILSTSSGKICFSNILLQIVSRTKSIIPSPFLFLSNWYGLQKPSIKNSKKVSSSFVSVTARMSLYFRRISFNCSQLFLIELTFHWQLSFYSNFWFVFFFTLLKEFGDVSMAFVSDWSVELPSE